MMQCETWTMTTKTRGRMTGQPTGTINVVTAKMVASLRIPAVWSTQKVDEDHMDSCIVLMVVTLGGVAFLFGRVVGDTEDVLGVTNGMLSSGE